LCQNRAAIKGKKGNKKEKRISEPGFAKGGTERQRGGFGRPKGMIHWGGRVEEQRKERRKENLVPSRKGGFKVLKGNAVRNNRKKRLR